MRARSGSYLLPILVIIMAGMLCPVPAYSQNTKAQEARKARLQKEIEIIDSQLRTNASKSSSALNRLALVRKKMDARKELLEESDRQIAGFTKAIGAMEKEIKAAQQRLDTLSEYYTRLVRSAYKNRNTKVWYMYILASDNLGQAFRRYGYLRDLSAQMKVQAEKIIEAKAALESEKASLQAEETDSRNLVNQLERNRKKYQGELDRKRREVDALNREIERIIRNAMGGSKSGKASGSKEIDIKLANEFKANKGKLPWPVEGPVVDRFGQNYHPVYTKIKLHFNNGINIAVSPGTGVKAVFDGVVKQIVVMPGYNKCVLIQHGDYFSFYCKLGSVSVKAGDKVKTGQEIGTVDTMNGETQLHFQIWSGRTPQNPEIWLRP